MSRTLFISDLHLDAARPEVTSALAAFLDSNTDCAALYVLGDLFEAWVGDDDDAPLVTDVARLFRTFSDAGPALFFMCGNRDFLLGEDWCGRAGGKRLPDPSVINLFDTPVLLMHGDSLCTSDAEYMRFRAMARNPDWQAQVLDRPLAERRALAVQLRAQSREANSNKAEDIMDVTPTEVEREMAVHGVRTLIHGHTHRPAHHPLASGDRWVLGDWDSHGWFIEATSSGFDLKNFPI